MNLNLIEAALADLPPEYEPLLLTFYHPALRVVHEHVVIGTDGGTELHVDIESGHVLSVASSGYSTTRFVNSSIEQLAQGIAAYVRYADQVAAVDDEAAAHQLVQELRSEIAGIDNAAIVDPDSWWSLILEQADHGLL